MPHIIGDQEIFKLLSRSSKERTYAMEVRDIGSLVKTLRHKNSEVEVALTMVNSAIIVSDINGGMKLSKAITGGETTDFTIAAVTGAAVDTEVESESNTYAWSRDEIDVSVDAGEYSINDGVYTSVAGKMYYGDTVKVKITSSSAPSTLVTANLTIGLETRAFDVTTAA